MLRQLCEGISSPVTLVKTCIASASLLVGRCTADGGCTAIDNVRIIAQEQCTAVVLAYVQYFIYLMICDIWEKLCCTYLKDGTTASTVSICCKLAELTALSLLEDLA